MQRLDGDSWRAIGDGTDAGALATLVGRRGDRLVAITGGVAAGKSTMAAAVAAKLPGATVVASDGFLLPAAQLAARGLAERKGFPESYDREALSEFLVAVAAGDPRAAAPVYSHSTYDIEPGRRVTVGGSRVVLVEGLHLAGDVLGVGDLFDLVVHLDADDSSLEAWYLQRFRTLRTAASTDPRAFLHRWATTMEPEALDAVALDVWRTVNLSVLHQYVRPAAVAADVVLHLGPDHLVREVESKVPAGDRG